MKEKMSGTLFLRKRPETDQPTLVGKRRGQATTETQGGWSTKLRIYNMDKVKGNNLSHL